MGERVPRLTLSLYRSTGGSLLPLRGPTLTKGPTSHSQSLQEYRSFPAPTEGSHTRPDTAMREGDVSGSTGCNTPREGQGSGVPCLEVSSWGGGAWLCGWVCGGGGYLGG